MTNELTAMLTYDMPVHSKLPNPSAALRRMGLVAVTESVWVGTLASMGMVPVPEWQARGAKVSLVKFAPDEYETVRRLAREALERTLAEMRSRLTAQTEKAERLFIEAEQHQSVKDVRAARSYANAVLRRAKHLIASAKEAAIAFDFLRETEELLRGCHAAMLASEEVLAANRARTLHVDPRTASGAPVGVTPSAEEEAAEQEREAEEVAALALEPRRALDDEVEIEQVAGAAQEVDLDSFFGGE